MNLNFIKSELLKIFYLHSLCDFKTKICAYKFSITQGQNQPYLYVTNLYYFIDKNNDV